MKQKLKKSEQIILLKAKVIKLERKFKEAKSELANRDNEVDELLTKIAEHQLTIVQLSGFAKSESKNPSKSSVEFRGIDDKTVKGGYVFKLENGLKYYAIGIQLLKEDDWTDNIKEAKVYSDLEEFKDDYGINNASQYRFEPIQPEPSTPEQFEQKLKSATKEVIDNVKKTTKK